jgi:hypothetical protein
MIDLMLKFETNASSVMFGMAIFVYSVNVRCYNLNLWSQQLPSQVM